MVLDEVSEEERARRASENSDLYYDPERRFEPIYQRKIREHYAVYSYLTATRRDAPNYRQVLMMLVAKGFGIAEWRGICGAIIQHQLFSSFLERVRDSVKKEGGIEDPLESDRLVSADEEFVATCAGVLGLIDHGFF